MTITLFRILFFCLVPIGIFILVKTIRMLKKLFTGQVIAEIPFTQKEVVFKINTKGIYALWQKGQLYRRTPVDKFRLRLVRDPAGEEVVLQPSFFRPYINGFDTGRMEMNRFSAESGSYRLTIAEGPDVSLFEKLVFRLFPAKPVDYNQYFIQVRESLPLYYMFISIPLFTLSAFCILGGFVAGFMAPGILAGMGYIYPS
jgi:hypothetical protein